MYRPFGWLAVFKTHLLTNETDLRYIKEILVHSILKTAETFTYKLTLNNKSVKTPLDFLRNFNIFEDNSKVSRPISASKNRINKE